MTSSSIDDPIEPLDTKERRALELYAGGLAEGAIAKQMRLTQTAVASHLAQAVRKLRCKTRANAVLKARELGIVESDLADPSRGPELSAVSNLERAAKRADADGDIVHAGTFVNAAAMLRGFRVDDPSEQPSRTKKGA